MKANPWRDRHPGARATPHRRAKSATNTTNKLSENEHVFDDYASLIRIQYNLRKANKSHCAPPFDTANGFLKTECYRLIRKYITSQGGHKIIQGICHKLLEKQIENPSYAENPFYWGLAAIFPYRDEFSQQDLSKFAMQMLYANRNEIEANHLVGFLYQIGGPKNVGELLKQETPDESIRRQALRPPAVQE